MMQSKILVVSIIENENGEILLRKKPDGSLPYAETWYIFGAELQPGENIEATLATHIRKQVGIETELIEKIGWDDEVKQDIDGVVKHFIYLDVISRYTAGDLVPDVGIEKLEWVAKERLYEYDNVPPSVKLFKKLGWMK